MDMKCGVMAVFWSRQVSQFGGVYLAGEAAVRW